MKKLCCGLLLLFGLLTQAQASTVIWALTNFDQTLTTNATIIQPVGQPLANGTRLVTGLAHRYTNDLVTASWTNSFQPGTYQLSIEGISLQHPIYFLVGNDSNTYFLTDLLVSGGNFFALTGVRRVTSNDGSLSLNPANGVGVLDLSSLGFGNGVWIVRSNGNGTNLTISGTFAVGTGAPDVVGTYPWSFGDTMTRGGPSGNFLDFENRSDPTGTNDAYFVLNGITATNSATARIHLQMGGVFNASPFSGQLFDIFLSGVASQSYTLWTSNGVRVVGMYNSNNVWFASGFTDNSGSPGSLVGYGSGGILNNRLIGVNLSGDITTSGGTATTMKNTGTAGTYTKVTFDAQGRETSGTSSILASSDFANQGTTTTVLHGNASGNPSFGSTVENDFGFTDVTTANASTSAHGLLPKLTGADGWFLVRSNGVGVWSQNGGASTNIDNATSITTTTINAKGKVSVNYFVVTNQVAYVPHSWTPATNTLDISIGTGSAHYTNAVYTPCAVTGFAFDAGYDEQSVLRLINKSSTNITFTCSAAGIHLPTQDLTNPYTWTNGDVLEFWAEVDNDVTNVLIKTWH